jgi:SPP1 gp7 family putative phage head morphogenesis protein
MAKAFNHEAAYRREADKAYDRIGKVVQSIISFHVKADGTIDDNDALTRDLQKYSESLEKWANRFWSTMLIKQAKALSRDFKRAGLTIEPYEERFKWKFYAMLREQVDLIKTLPLNAATEAQKLAHRAATETGERAETLIETLQGLKPGYPEYAARRLARTEIAKTQSLIVQAQAESLGIKQYVWRTVKDEAVRDSHAAMDGKVCDFETPPEVEPGKFYHAGRIHNCRCYAEPLLPQVLKKNED